jgi:hypothetical protein
MFIGYKLLQLFGAYNLYVIIIIIVVIYYRLLLLGGNLLVIPDANQR